MRVTDSVDRSNLDCAGLLVLDEADQLLAPQFAADVSRLAMHCGKRAAGGLQTVVVSATLSSQVSPLPPTAVLLDSRVHSRARTCVGTFPEVRAAVGCWQSVQCVLGEMWVRRPQALGTACIQ